MNKKLFTMKVEEEELAEWKAKAGTQSLAAWIKERCSGEDSRVPDVPREAEVPASRRRKSVTRGIEGLPVVGEQPTGSEEGPKCRHGIGKGYHCWQCGGLAQTGGKDE